MSGFEYATKEDLAQWARDAEEAEAKDVENRRNGNRGQGGYQCLCGRFAKFAGDRHYYNGFWDCYSYDVECSRCGVVTVECV